MGNASSAEKGSEQQTSLLAALSKAMDPKSSLDYLQPDADIKRILSNPDDFKASTEQKATECSANLPDGSQGPAYSTDNAGNPFSVLDLSMLGSDVAKPAHLDECQSPSPSSSSLEMEGEEDEDEITPVYASPITTSVSTPGSSVDFENVHRKLIVKDEVMDDAMARIAPPVLVRLVSSPGSSLASLLPMEDVTVRRPVCVANV